MEYITDELEDDYFAHFRTRLVESDKAWDAMHRALTDGQLEWENGTYPLNLVVLGGERLYTRSDYIMSLKTPEQVQAIAAALPAVTEAQFRQGYLAIDPKDYEFMVDEEDFKYTWSSFEDVRQFYSRAAKEGCYVLFTADQ